MFTSFINPRSLVLAVAISGFLGTGTANGETPNSPKTPFAYANAKTAHSIPQRVTRKAYAHDFRGWTARCYFNKYRCNGYYSPAKRQWYYWYAPFNRFLPVSYLTIYPPTNAGILPGGIIPGGIGTGGQMPLPPGAVDAPPPDQPDAPEITDLKKSKKSQKMMQDN